MNDQTPSSDTPTTVAQELGADPAVAAAQTVSTGALEPLALGRAIRELTRAHPFTMLGLAFLAGAAYVGRRRR
jgi:LPXTG-motif cell wall-anchored protein